LICLSSSHDSDLDREDDDEETVEWEAAQIRRGGQREEAIDQTPVGSILLALEGMFLIVSLFVRSKGQKSIQTCPKYVLGS
jgi:hypothetical protein